MGWRIALSVGLVTVGILLARWGDPGLIVAAVSAENGQVYCFDKLDLDVQVVGGHNGVGRGIGRADYMDTRVNARTTGGRFGWSQGSDDAEIAGAPY